MKGSDIPMSAIIEPNSPTEAIIVMGKNLSLNVVAEGVETKEEENFLREQVCDAMQGFYFSKPIAPDKFADLLRNHHNDSLKKCISMRI